MASSQTPALDGGDTHLTPTPWRLWPLDPSPRVCFLPWIMDE